VIYKEGGCTISSLLSNFISIFYHSLYNKMIIFYGILNHIDWCKLLDKMLDICNDIFT
jgi:hypothetical protein